MNKIKKEGKFSIELRTESFENRFKKLFRSGKKIVYIKEVFDNSTFRYRCYNVIQALSRQDDYVVTYFLTNELDSISDYIEEIDIVIFQRSLWDVYVENFTFLSRISKIPIIYDIDDLVINPKYVPLYLNNLGIVGEDHLSYDHFYFASKYYTVASRCDGFITTNDFLGNIIKKDFQKPIWVIPNFLNIEQEYHSEIIRRTKKKDMSKFVLGYFSGSPSHTYDFAIIINELVELFEKYDDIYLKIVGHIGIPERLRKYKERIICVPFLSYEELQYEIGGVDLNLVPLQNNMFNNCKSELKFFEAGIVKVPSCCSPTYVYKEIIRDGENGFLCKEGEWFSKIEMIYRGKYDIDKISKKAFKTSKDLYGVENQKRKIIKVYEDILDAIKSKKYS